MRKTVVAAAMAASLTVGGAAGVALFTPSLSSAQSEDAPADQTATDGSTSDEPDADRAERIAELLAPLVDDGTITQEQADAVAERLADALPDRRPHHGFGLDIIDAVRDALGLDPGELRDRLAAGDSLADIAADEGVDLDAVKDALTAAQRAFLDEAVAAGRLDQDRADELASRFAERLDDLVQGSLPPGLGRGPGHHGPRGFFDLGDRDAADEPTDS